MLIDWNKNVFYSEQKSKVRVAILIFKKKCSNYFKEPRSNDQKTRSKSKNLL